MRKTKLEVMKWLKDYIVNKLSFKGEVTEETLTADLGTDSLDTVEFVMAMEQEFSISLPEDLMEKLTTIGEVRDAIIAALPDAKK